MRPAATMRAAWHGLTGRPLQAIIIGVVALASTAASALALGMAVQASAPFDHAFARDRGAQVAITVNTARATPARLAATTGLHGVTAAAGPFPLAEVSTAITLAGQTNVPGTLLSVYTPAELVLLALGGLLIAVGGALGPATWVARTRTATALRAE
jgi:hypothetical protein